MSSSRPGESGQHKIELEGLRLPDATDWDGEKTEITGVRAIIANQARIAGDTEEVVVEEEAFVAADVIDLDYDDVEDTIPDFNLASEMFDED